MSKEQNISYVMDEEISSPKEKTQQTGDSSKEVLRSFRHNISHLDEMIKKVNGLEKNAVKNTDTVNILNNLLQKSGLWGANGGMENKAYFTRHEGHIVLVLNTVVEGKKVSSFWDIQEILAKVDGLLNKDVQSTQKEGGKKEVSTEEKIHRASKRLGEYALQIQEINSTYRENTNDFYMAADAIMDLAWGKSGKKTYEEIIKNIQRTANDDYEKLGRSIDQKQLSPEELRKFTAYQNRILELTGQRLEEVQSFTGYVATEKKMDMLRSAGYAIKGMGEGAFDAFTGTIVFAYTYASNPDVRDAIHSSVGNFYEYLKENSDNPDKLWKDFLEAVDKEMTKVKNLPAEQQAEAIGKITGNIMATIIGAKGMNTLMKSGKLRLKFKTPEVVNPAEIKPNFTTSGKRLVSKTAQDDKGISYISKRKAGALRKEIPKEVPKNIVTKIDDVKNWSDLESFISTVDRVRFKEGVTGKVIQEMVDDVRHGTRKVSEIPDYGWIRDVVKKLKENGGKIPDPKGIKEKTLHAIDQGIKKGVENTGKILPFKEARSFLNKKILTGYDHIDVAITKLRVLTGTKMSAIGDVLSRTAHIQEMKELTNKTIESIKAISFPGKEGVLENLEKLSQSLGAMKEKWGDILRTDLVEWAKGNEQLTRRQFQALNFDEGLAVREVRKSVQGKEVTLYEYRDMNGKKLSWENKDGKNLSGSEFTYASNFKDGKASVTTKDGKNLTIDTKGNIIMEHAEVFSSIQRFGNGGYRVFENGNYRIVYPEWHKGANTNYKSWKYTFMTEIHENMAIGVDKKWIKYIINDNKERFRTPFHYVDDFSEYGVSAVQNTPGGKWLLIDREGNLLRKDGSLIRGNGEIVDANGKSLSSAIGKGKNKTFDEKAAKEARDLAFEEEWFDTNLAAIKSHIDKQRKMMNPEVMMKTEQAALDLLKEHKINAIPGRFSHAQTEGFLTYEDTKGKRIINMEKEMVSKDTFSYVHTPDIEKWFIRVLKDENHMGVIDLSGRTLIEPKYTNIQIHDDARKLFEVTEMRRIGDRLKDGTIISPHFSDPPGATMVERVGLVDRNGNSIIETGYIEVTKANDTTSQGLIRAEDHTILHKSQGSKIDKYSEHGISGKNMTSGNHSFSSFAVMAGSEASMGGRSGGQTLNILRNETSTIISELEVGSLAGFIYGAQEFTKQSPLFIQSFLKNKLSNIRSLQSLDTEVGKMIHEQVGLEVRKYLEKNELGKLTKKERIAVAEHEKELRDKFVSEIKERAEKESVFSRSSITNERDAFINALAETYRSFNENRTLVEKTA